MKFTLSGRYSEQSLLKGCLKGARDSQKALYDQYSSRMYSICLRYAGTETDAEDLLQEGFLRIFKNIGTFRNEGSFEGWMRRIFVNTAIEKHRKKHHLYPLMDVSDSDTFVMDSGIVNQMAADDIMCLVEQLSPGYRTVFNLYVVEGYGHKDIAKMMGISIGTSKSQLARARQILKEKIETLNRQYQHAIGG